ncbi:MAG: DUF3343 domain-containing protein [Spirochaetaceae bacterium]|jgi:hypothetical protein|nr:DUF3343 domain-containing protein [Spirochaetaceae bacterium]
MNNEPTGEVIFIFHTAHGAIMGERTLHVAGVEVKVMPVPSSLGPACGIALRVNPEDAEKTAALLGQSVKGVYQRTILRGDKERFVLWNP